MKKLIVAVALSMYAFATGFATNDDCNQTITRSQLTICYNYKYKDAEYSKYYATSSQVKKKMDRLSFKSDPKIPKQYRAYNSDYYKTGYDKFHLCPDNIMDFNKTALQSTYYLSNVVPGDAYTNRYRWTKIERLETKFYEEHNISYSITGTIFTKQAKSKTIGSHKIAVPEYFYKCFGTNPKDVQCYTMVNRKLETAKTKDVLVNKVTLKHLNSLLPYSIKFDK